MVETNLTNQEYLKQIDALQNRISELETVKAAYEQVEEELRLRHTQLKASEKELKQTHDLLKEHDDHITKLKSVQQGADKKLLSSERRFLNLVEHFPGMVAIQDIKQRKYVYWNRANSWTGHTLEEWNLLSYNDQKTLIHPEDRSQYMQLLREWVTMQSDEPLNFSYRLRHKDGHYLWIECFFYKDYGSENQLAAQIELSRDITPLKRAEEKYKGIQEKYRTLTDYQNEVIYRVDRERRFVFVSPSYCEIFEKNQNDLIGHEYLPPIHEEDIETTKTAMQSITQAPYECNVENRVLTKDGWRWFGWHHKALLDSKDNIVGIITTGRDITDIRHLKDESSSLKDNLDLSLEERTAELIGANAKLVKKIEHLKQDNAAQLEKRAKLQSLYASVESLIYKTDPKSKTKSVRENILEALKVSDSEFKERVDALEQEGESQRRQRSNLQMLYDSVDDMIFVIDSNGSLITANPIFRSRLGYSKDDIKGLNILELHPPNHRYEASTLFSDLLSGKSKSHTVPLFTKDHETISVDTRFTLSRWENKNVIIAISRDITAIRKAEDELKASMQTFRTLAEQSACGVCIMQDETIHYANDHFAGIFELSPDEITSEIVGSLEKAVHPDDRGVFTKAAMKKRRKEMADQVKHQSFRTVNPKGETVWADMYSKLIDYEGKPADLILLIDCTEGKHAEEIKLKNEIRNRENHKQESIERLAGTVAHSFNELLTIITGHSELALMSVSKIDPIRINIEAINGAAVEGSNLTWQLLTFARKFIIQPKVLDAKNIVENIEKSLRRVLGRKVDFVIKTPKNLGKIHSDHDQFERAFLNIIQNTKEAMLKEKKE